MIPVPLFDLQFLVRVGGDCCRNCKSAALAAHYRTFVGAGKNSTSLLSHSKKNLRGADDGRDHRFQGW
jgi:hypothetical protein